MPLLLEVAGSFAVIVAVGVAVNPWLATALGGILLIGAGYLMENDQ